MSKIYNTKKTERAGVNQFRALLEAAGHIVQEIDGGNDYGEDCFLSLTEHGRRTGDIIAVQIKSGLSYKRAIGYSIPCKQHVDDWALSRIPVIGVVFDPEIRKLYWVNMTKSLLEALEKGRRLRRIPLGESDILDERTVRNFTVEVRKFAARHDHLTGRPRGSSSTSASIQRYLNRNANAIENPPLGGHTIPPFAGMVDFIERHPRLLIRVVVALLSAVIAITLIAAFPGQLEFARQHNEEGWSWLVCFYGSIMYFLIFGMADPNKKRAQVLRMAGFSIFTIGWFMGSDLYDIPMEIEALFAGAVITLAKLCAFYLCAFYVKQEISRRRRLKAAYGEDLPEAGS